MLDKAALFATMIAGAGLTGAILLGQPQGAAAAPQEAAPPAPQAEPMSWHMLREGATAKLAYGVANSDQILMMMSCEPGDQAVEVFGLATPEGDAVAFTSASRRSDVAAEVRIDPMTGAAAFEARIPLDALALRGFRETGRLTLVGAGQVLPAHAADADRAGVDAFFDHCASQRV